MKSFHSKNISFLFYLSFAVMLTACGQNMENEDSSQQGKEQTTANLFGSITDIEEKEDVLESYDLIEETLQAKEEADEARQNAERQSEEKTNLSASLLGVENDAEEQKIRELENTLKKEPTNYKKHTQLGIALMSQSNNIDYEKALSHFQEAAKSPEQKTSLYANFQIISIYNIQGDQEAAHTLSSKVLQEGIEEACKTGSDVISASHIYAIEAEIAIKQGKFEQAEQYLLEGVQCTTYQGDESLAKSASTLLISQISQLANFYTIDQSLIDHACQYAQESDSARTQLCGEKNEEKTIVESGTYVLPSNEALTKEQVSALLKNDPNSSELNYQMGTKLMSETFDESLIPYFQKGAESKNANLSFRSLYQLVSISRLYGEKEDTLSLIQKGLTKYEETDKTGDLKSFYFSLFLYQGEVYMINNQAEKALESFTQAKNVLTQLSEEALIPTTEMITTLGDVISLFASNNKEIDIPKDLLIFACKQDTENTLAEKCNFMN